MPRDQVPTTQTLLQDGAKRIRGEFADALEVKFDLLFLLGRIQLHLGQYASAEPLLREALSIANVKFRAASVEWLEAQTEWARVQLEQNHFALAAQQLSAAIATHEHAGAADSDALVQSLSLLGRICSDLDQPDQSVATSWQALRMARRLHGENRPEVQEALESLGKMLLHAERLGEAESIDRTDVALSNSLYGEHNAKYAKSLAVLANVLADENKNAESERLGRQALSIEESVYDGPNAEIISTLGSLSDTLFNEDKLDEHDAVLRRWLAAQTQLKGQDDPSITPILANMGLLEERRHQYQQDEQVLRRALAIYAKRPDGAQKSLEADIWRNLADALIAQHRFPEAAGAAQKAREIDLRAFGDHSHRFGADLTESARLDMEMGRLQPALDRVDAALEILGKCPPDIDLVDDVNEASLQKAAIQNRLGRHDDAKSLLVPLVARLRQAASDYAGHHRLAKSLAELGRAQAGSADISAALASWNEALTWQQSVRSPDTDAIAELQGLIGQALKARRDTKHLVPRLAQRDQRRSRLLQPGPSGGHFFAPLLFELPDVPITQGAVPGSVGNLDVPSCPRLAFN
ncbi:MAG TPA: tetratricopeptide repeat protein [Xanthomonadaceae bacterium]|nr:tetratricopeptide repeat protein [Xanthomonadaceae bacterium]